MDEVMNTLAQQLNENLGNRLTPALANGILYAVGQVVDKLKAEEASKPPVGAPTP